MLTGKNPNTHKLKTLHLSRFKRKQSQENLPFLLKDLGYYNVAVIGNPVAIPWRLNIRGFDETYSYIAYSKPITEIIEFLSAGGVRSGTWLVQILTNTIPLKNLVGLVNKVRCWWGLKLIENRDNLYFATNILRKAFTFLQNKKEPFFLWIHLWPPHHPYFGDIDFFLATIGPFIDIINNSYKSEDQTQVDILSSLYDKHLEYADQDLSTFLEMLSKEGFLESSILVITSDHGEMFEKGFWMHGGPYLYQPLVHVPLVIHLPGQKQGRKIEPNVSHVDLAPTILEVLGETPPAWMEGVSFAKAFADPHFKTGPKFTMNLSYLRLHDIKTKSVAAIRGDYKLIKYIDLEEYELYDLKNDPHEMMNLVHQKPDVFQNLKKEIDNLFKDN